MYQPKGAALILFKDVDQAHQAMSYGGGYLSAPNIGLLGSTPASALPLAATLMHWGREGLAKHIDSDMTKAEHLKNLVQDHPDFELWGPSETGIVVWRPKTVSAKKVRANLKDAWVSLTDIEGEMWLRSVAANPSADPDFVFKKVLEASLVN